MEKQLLQEIGPQVKQPPFCHNAPKRRPGPATRRAVGPEWRSGALWSGVGWQVRDPAATPTFTGPRGISLRRLGSVAVGSVGVWRPT